MSTYTLTSPDALLGVGLLKHDVAKFSVQICIWISVSNIEPDIAVDWTWQDYVSGVDRVAAAAVGGVLRCPISNALTLTFTSVIVCPVV